MKKADIEADDTTGDEYTLKKEDIGADDSEEMDVLPADANSRIRLVKHIDLRQRELTNRLQLWHVTAGNLGKSSNTETVHHILKVIKQAKAVVFKESQKTSHGNHLQFKQLMKLAVALDKAEAKMEGLENSSHFSSDAVKGNRKKR